MKKPKAILKKTIGIVSIVIVAASVLAAAIYSAFHFSKQDKVEGALGDDLSSSVVGEDGSTKTPIEIIDPDGNYYEKPDAGANVGNDGQIHDENGKNDPNRYEKDDPFGSMDIEENEKNDTEAVVAASVAKQRSRDFISRKMGARKDDIYNCR